MTVEEKRLLDASRKEMAVKSKWQVLYEVLLKTFVSIHVFNMGFILRGFIKSKFEFRYIVVFCLASILVAGGCLAVYMLKYEEIKYGE